MWWIVGVLVWLVIVKFTLKVFGVCASRRDIGDDLAKKYFEKNGDNNNAN